MIAYRIPGISDVLSIVFDGVFLTAQRSERSAKVGVVLDAAGKNGRVVFGTEAVPFTSSLSPEEAVGVLEGIPTAELTSEARRTFWSMMSGLPEQDHRHQVILESHHRRAIPQAERE